MDKDVGQCIDREIGHFMVDNNLTQREMADMLDMSRNTLRSKRMLGTWQWSEVLKISEITGKPLDVLAGIKSA